MNNALSDLQKLITARSTPQRGSIVSVSGQEATVSTRKGVLTLRIDASDVTDYRVGDLVQIEGGVIVGRTAKELPVYIV